MIQIENDAFSAAIRTEGAELASLQQHENQREWIWQADPDVWGSSAPILFPIVGFLKNGTTFINGASYSIPKHGVLRRRMATVLEQKRESVVLQFESGPDTLAVYPFPFRFRVHFRLQEDGLEVDYTIENCGEDAMLFSVGSHPAFALDLKRYALTDYHLEFSEPETLDLYGLKDNLLALKQEAYLKGVQRISLTEEIFHDDALIFKKVRSRRIGLVCSEDPLRLEMEIGEAPHLGIWAKPGAPYVCIEPWFTYNDAKDSEGLFETKPGIMSLPSKEMFKTGYRIRISKD